MRNGRRMVVLLSILLLVCTAGFFLSAAKNSRGADSTIYRLEDGSVEAIRVASRNSEVRFEKKGGKWTMVQPSGFQINETLADGIAGKLENLAALRVIEKKPANLGTYGLENPGLAVTFRWNGGEEKTLLIGDETASKYQRYVKDSGTNAVYTLSLTDTETFGDGTPSFYRDRNLFTIDSKNINLLTLDSDGKTMFQLLEEKPGKWRFREPCMANARNDMVNDIVKRISGLTIMDFVEDAPVDPGRYGLDKPEFSLGIGDRYGNLQSIRFGKMDEEKQVVFVSVNEEKSVYSISTKDFHPKEIKMTDLFNETPLSIGIGSVKEVVINDRGLVAAFSRDLSKPDEDLFLFQGRETIREDFISLYVDLMALTSEGYDASNTGDDPEMTVSYESLEGDARIELSLSRRDEKTYFLTVDEEPLPFYVSAQKVELVRRWMKRVMEGC